MSEQHGYICQSSMHGHLGTLFSSVVLSATQLNFSIIRHSMGLVKNVRLGDFQIREGLLAYVTVPHKMVGLERMSDYRHVGRGEN